jgi:hypothetical protein
MFWVRSIPCIVQSEAFGATFGCGEEVIDVGYPLSLDESFLALHEHYSIVVLHAR